MAAELPRPGVEVLQVFQAVSPTVVTPTLVPVIVGVCKQIVQVIIQSATGSNELNPAALIDLPGFFIADDATGSPPAYLGLNGLDLVLSIDNGSDVTITFSGNSLSPAAVVAQIQAAFLAQNVTAATVEETPDSLSFRVSTVGLGEFESITIRPGTAPLVLSTFGLVIGYTYTGTSLYSQYIETIPLLSFPNPRNNLDELVIDPTSVEVFLDLGSGTTHLRQLSETTAFLRRGGGGTAAAVTGTVTLSGLTYATIAEVTGTNDATAGALYGSGGTLDGKALTLNVNGAGATTLNFVGTGNTATEAALLAAIVVQWPTLRASIGGSGSNKLVLATLLEGTGASIVVTSTTGATALGLSGSSTGTNGSLSGQTLNVSIDGTTPAVAISMAAGFLNTTELLEVINSTLGGVYASMVGGFLVITSRSKGTSSGVALTGSACATLGLSVTPATGVAGVVVVDSGNGSALSPILDFVGKNWTTTETSASCTGVHDLTTLSLPGDLNGLTLELAVSGNKPQTLLFDSTIIDVAHILSAIETFWPDLVATDPGNFLVLTTTEKGEQSTIDVLGGTALFKLGLVPSITGTVDLTTILPDLSRLNGLNVKFNLGGTAVQHTFSGLLAESTATEVSASLNADTAFNTLAVASIVSSKLQIQLLIGGSVNGIPYTIGAVPAASAEAAYWLGFDTAAPASFNHFEGTGFPPISGDSVFVDGTLVGNIVQVAPGGVTSRLKVNKQLNITSNFGTFYYLVANNLVVGQSHRPSPELVVDGSGVPTIAANLLRDTNGNPLLAAAFASVYLSYAAIRQDVTALAKTPSLLSFNSTTQLDSLLAPVDVTNPLALGVYFALLNGPGIAVTALGVDATSGDEPFGTVEAWTRAATALEQYEVYAIAPLTHDPTVGQIWSTHVTAMSQPDAKGERICLYNFHIPTARNDTLVASGVNGNSIGSSGLTFDTAILNLSALVLNNGINPVGTIPVSAGLYLDIGDGKHYSITTISGSIVTLVDTFSAGQNDDGYYSTTPFTPPLINQTFAVRVRGAALVLPDGTPDKPNIALTMQQTAQAILNRRFWSIVPDQCAATINGVEQVIDGFYLSSAIAGMIGQQPPQQSFTNFPMTGFTRVIGSNDFFTDSQLNIIAAGGNYIVVQDVANGPLTSRMALTTDMTSIETRTDSITKIVDFTAKFMRQGLRAYIGRFNITQGFLDSLGHVTQGLLGYLTDIGVLIGAHMNNIVQDETAPDTVLIDVTLDPPFPCNYIRLTLVI